MEKIANKVMKESMLKQEEAQLRSKDMKYISL
jgi:hypothetical protein